MHAIWFPLPPNILITFGIFPDVRGGVNSAHISGGCLPVRKFVLANSHELDLPTVKSFPFTDILCKIIGCRNLKPREVFLSNYGKNDYLSLHHDINKGDITVTISFTYDWDPVYGGILHFCDDDKNIYKSIVPKLGNINIFKLDLSKGIDHFVSTVNVDKNRYTLVAWYQYID